ncbi:hypothetical protein FOC1_g10002715 [Fusarium oxysporum f. sp. cubense race 1]|uniref:Uncharacterized protein n=1 Tax=Fusarium oxysporum f. sp. cubense (strain race 1) TaxID=1229664 RepID=N4TQP5_FUSC1|nr:hypothetical protein FOC1_g10002715 [Fusarium oxysporum f. sp. cubense race 1]
MRSDYDLSNIMYGAETAAELDFYRGRPTASKCRLLQMPSEILAKIISFVAEDKKALQQLALVNSDCSGTRLLLELVKHIVAGRAGPGISDCIRKFTFKPDPYQYQGAAQVDEEATSIFSQTQRAVVLNFKAMCNLETLVWSCNFPLDKDTFSLFASSTAHTLMMNRTIIAQEFSLRPPLTPPSWPFLASFLSAPLKSLELRHSAIRDFKDLISSHVEEPYRDLEELVVDSDENLHLITELIHKHNNLKKL